MKPLSNISTNRIILISLLACCAVFWTGCGEEENLVLESYPNIETIPTSETGLIFFASGGEQVSEKVRIKNTGDAALDIKSIQLVYEPQSPTEEETGPAFTMGLDVPEFPHTLGWDGQEGDEPTKVDFSVVYRHYEDGRTREAKLVIESNDPDQREVTIDIKVQLGAPDLVVQPDQVVFTRVTEGEQEVQSLNILNTGTAPLKVQSFLLLGHKGFHLTVDNSTYDVNDIVELDPAIEIPQASSIQVDLVFEPLGQEPAEGQLVIQTNDRDYPSGLEVPLFANLNLPCLELDEPKDGILDFQGKLVGQQGQREIVLRNCGAMDVNLTNILLSEDSSTDFDLDLSIEECGQTALATPVDYLPEAETPIVIGVGGSVCLAVNYLPDEENPMDPETGERILDTGKITIENNSFEEVVEIAISGFGATQLCPTAVIDIVEGLEVIPQTTLHLKSDKSYAPIGEISEYLWDVDQPTGSKSVFVPSSTWPNPTFQVNVAGEYLFQLSLTDSEGQESCENAYATVVVIPDEAIHVELLWNTPSDPDQTDEGPGAGTDMDLHFVHDGFAGGMDLDYDGYPDGWFDLAYDCFWFNPYPDWGSIDPNADNDPGLDRDDTDGAGPENLNLNEPEDVIYKVGVHYFEDNGIEGYSQPTVRIYIFTSLLLEVDGPEMVENDMWEVALIDWSVQQATPVYTSTNGFKVIPNYPTGIKNID